jgi:hypothetical protein
MNSFLKGFLSIFDWMFQPKSYQETSEELDRSMQDFYDKNGWGRYSNPLTRSISSDEWNSMIKENKTIEEVYEPTKTNLTQEQKFVIFWLYNRVAENMSSNPIKGGDNNIIVNGIDVTETVRQLLQDRLFV